jgi:heat shock protein HslJ
VTRRSALLAAFLALAPAALAAQPPPLAGTEWVVAALAGETWPSMSPATILMADDGRAMGSSGCNRWTGSWRAEGAEGALAFGPVAITRRVCVPRLMAAERRFLAALAATAAATVAPDGTLTLSDAAGAPLLVAQPRA